MHFTDHGLLNLLKFMLALFVAGKLALALGATVVSILVWFWWWRGLGNCLRAEVSPD